MKYATLVNTLRYKQERIVKMVHVKVVDYETYNQTI